MNTKKLIRVGEFYQELNDIVGTNLPLLTIYRSKGLSIHLKKQKHLDCLRHIGDIPDIIRNPDYVGVNPRQARQGKNTIELIKKFDKNILVGIKLDTSANYLYISTMYSVQESKIRRRLHSGRIKKII